jgi:hypothetical protein
MTHQQSDYETAANFLLILSIEEVAEAPLIGETEIGEANREIGEIHEEIGETS